MKNILLFVLFIALVSCKNDDPGMELRIEVPTTYSFERNGQSTVSYSEQITRIGMAEELIAALKELSAGKEQLLEMFTNQSAAGGETDPYGDPDLNASTISIWSQIATSEDFFSSNPEESAEIKAFIESWIIALAEEVLPAQGTLAVPGVAGQIEEGSSLRYVTAKGVEYQEIVSKSILGALMLDQVLNHYLSPAVLDAGDNRILNDNGTPVDGQVYTAMEHLWDEAYGYIFGSATDKTNPLATLGDDDIFLNRYLQRVDRDKDFSGIAKKTYEAFKIGRAAIVAGDYEIRDAQIKIIREALSKVAAVRTVYYLQGGKSKLPADGDLTQYGPAFNALSEAFGFIYSLRFTRRPDSSEAYFTKAEVEGYMDLLMQGNGFWEVSAETLDAVSEAIAGKFDFSVAQARE